MAQYNLLEAVGSSRDREYTAIDRIWDEYEAQIE